VTIDGMRKAKLKAPFVIRYCLLWVAIMSAVCLVDAPPNSTDRIVFLVLNAVTTALYVWESGKFEEGKGDHKQL